MAFKDKYRDLQELVRELTLLRENNRAIKVGESQENLLLFAEAAVLLLTLERFLRILPGIVTTNKDTLSNLLKKATNEKRGPLRLPAGDQADAIRRITDVRNTILHGNFEQAAQQAGLCTVQEYFKQQFASEVEALYQITNCLFTQIEPGTGGPVSC